MKKCRKIDCLYKDCQTKMNLCLRKSLIRNQIGIVVTTNKSKKTKRIKNISHGLIKDNLNR